MTEKQFSDKHLEMFFLMDWWVRNLQQGKHVEEYFLERNYNNIAIYGMSYISKTLQNELQDSSIQIVLTCDSKTINLLHEYEKTIDVIVVTSLYHYYEIKCLLEKEVGCRIVSIGDVIYKI